MERASSQDDNPSDTGKEDKSCTAWPRQNPCIGELRLFETYGNLGEPLEQTGRRGLGNFSDATTSTLKLLTSSSGRNVKLASRYPLMKVSRMLNQSVNRCRWYTYPCGRSVHYARAARPRNIVLELDGKCVPRDSLRPRLLEATKTVPRQARRWRMQ